MFFSRSLRENEPKEGCYPQGPLQRGMQHEKSQKPTTFLRFGKPGHGLSFYIVFYEEYSNSGWVCYQTWGTD